jgi:chromosomal replication initiation ATPase DnaA
MKITIKYIKQLVEDYAGIGDLSVKTKEHFVARNRYICYYLSRKYTDCTQQQLADLYNMPDSSNIRVGLKIIKKNLNRILFRDHLDIYNKCLKVLEDND